MTKVVRGHKYVHRSALDHLTEDEQYRVMEAARLLRKRDWDVARVDPGGSVMLGRTTSWERPNPELLESWLVRGERVTHRTYRAGVRPKYHKTQLMLPNRGVGKGGTAISRRGPSAPVRYLHKHGLVLGSVHDFGSGIGEDADWLRDLGFKVREYDPNFEDVDKMPTGKYGTVLYTYVFNVLPKKEEDELLRQMRAKLSPNGLGYVTVRADVKFAGETSRGYQRPVWLDVPQMHSAPSGSRVYVVEPLGGR